MSEVVRVLAVLALVAGNAFFVTAEYAIITARRAALQARTDHARGRRSALRLMDDPVRVITTAQVGITAIGILTGVVSEPAMRALLGDALPSWLGFALAFAIVAYLTVVFGELVPKAVTLDRVDALTVRLAPTIEFVALLLHPIVWLLQGSAELVLRRFGVRNVTAGAGVKSSDELYAVVDEAEHTGVIPQAQEELLHNVFGFVRLEATDVMVPARKVVWLDANLTADAALRRALRHRHSRYPIADGSLDRPVGVAHVADIAAAAEDDPTAPVRTAAQTALTIPAAQDLGAVLRRLRALRQHLAVVVDRHGRSLGIVTIEDIVEEIVGEIENEFDLPDDTLARAEDGTVFVAGSMSVDDCNEALGTALPQDASHTVAGLVFGALRRQPRVGDAVEIAGVRLTVESVEGRRIARVRLELPGPPPVD